MRTDDLAAPMSRKHYIVGLAVIAVFYFIFGFLTWLNGILIPFLRTACELTNFQAYFVTTAFYVLVICKIKVAAQMSLDCSRRS